MFSGDTDTACRQIGAVSAEGAQIVGCHHGGVIVLPNPCTWPNRSDFADIACHELGHANLWPANHPAS